MSWFLIAMIGPFLYAITNHIDKILLEKYFKEGGVGTLLLFSSLLSILALPIIYLIDPNVVSVSFENGLFLILVSILDLLVLIFYFLALRDDEASIVVIFYQLVPVMGLGLGYVILGELLTRIQLLSMIIVIIGTSIISFEIDSENHFKVRKKTILYMLLAGFFWALEATLFKMVALEESVLQSLFWNSVILTVMGFCIFITIGTYRTNFIKVFKQNSLKIISVNVVNESLYMLGNAALAFAALLAPIAMILLMESFQAFFVLAIGILLTLYFPHINEEKVYLKNIMQKILAIVVTGIGTYLLLSSS